MPYIKSYSNYVINKEHQLTNDGKIYERDITTIGGLDNFSKGQVPIYRSGNFIITVNNEPSAVKDYSDTNWEKNPSGDTLWTLGNTTDENVEDKIEIPSNQEYYDLRDFAYYGSCAELIRGSLTDIINRFPGELYAPTVNGSGITVYKNADKNIENSDLVPIYDEGWFLLDNPFGINLHTEYINKNEVEDPLKYFCNEGFKNYEFISGNTVESNMTWSSTKTNPCSQYSENVVADIKINSETVNVKAVKTDNGDIVYLTNNLDWRVRPKQEFQDKFFKSLDSFQKVLLNRDSKPKYSALFQIIRENRFGYYTEMKRFTFPTTYGDYNLAVNDSAYSEYLNSLVDVSVLYDEYFSDNLYRAMTHEAIKNFDWSYTREYPNDNEGEYFIAGTRIQNTLRLFGREFDEIKRYIDGIGNSCALSYNNENNMPNFLLSDSLENEGWDITSIIPFILANDNGTNDKIVNQLEPINNEYVKYDNLVIQPYSANCNPNGYYINENCEKTLASNDVKNYVYVTIDESEINGQNDDKPSSINSNDKGILRPIFKQYFSDKEYTMQDVENHFMKLLRLNSRYIWRHKGTIEGIEMLLGLFGLKSKRFTDYVENKIRFFNPCIQQNDDSVENDNSTNVKYDYDITEYVYTSDTLPSNKKYPEINSVGTKEAQESTASTISKTIDEFNQTKTLVYNTDDYRNGVYNKYQGLPVKYYEEQVEPPQQTVDEGDSGTTASTTEVLVPYFDKNMIIDGNPYYQMKGGWLYGQNSNNSYYYTETIKNISSVDNLKSLLSIPYKDLINGSIYRVDDLSINYVFIDGIAYEIYNDYVAVDNAPQVNYEYFKVSVSNHSVKIGANILTGEIKVSSFHVVENSEGSVDVGTNVANLIRVDGLNEFDNNYEQYDLDNLEDGYEIKIYLLGDEKICFAYGTQPERTNLNTTIFIEGEVFSSENTIETVEGDGSANVDVFTNYFQIVNKKKKNELSDEGWKQLKTDDEAYERINDLKNYFKGNNPHSGNNQYDKGEEYLSYFEQLFKYAIEKKAFDLRCYPTKTMNEIINAVSGIGFALKEKVMENKIISFVDEIGDEPEVIFDNVEYPEQIINTKKIKITFKTNEDGIYKKYINEVVLKYLSEMIPSTAIVQVEFS